MVTTASATHIATKNNIKVYMFINLVYMLINLVYMLINLTQKVITTVAALQ